MASRALPRPHPPNGAGRGVEVPDPYDPPPLVRSAPRDLRRLLADALAEEATARTVSDLGMGFTVWHDVAVGADADDKLDHVVLGPPPACTGVMSEDFGGVVGFRRGEITGPSLGTRAPVTAALGRMRTIAKTARVRFSGAIIVLPDDDLARRPSHARHEPRRSGRRRAPQRAGDGVASGAFRRHGRSGGERTVRRAHPDLQQTVRFV